MKKFSINFFKLIVPFESAFSYIFLKSILRVFFSNSLQQFFSLCTRQFFRCIFTQKSEPFIKFSKWKMREALHNFFSQERCERRISNAHSFPQNSTQIEWKIAKNSISPIIWRLTPFDPQLSRMHEMASALSPTCCFFSIEISITSSTN